MTKKLLMLLSLLLCTGWLLAQEGGMSKGQGQMGKGEATKVEGCLQKSGSGFTLMDASGKMYDLQGDSSKLSEHVGHEVMITGTTSGSDSSMANSQEPVLQVDSLKHVAKTCKSAGKMSK